MANENPDTPNGFWPYRHGSGGTPARLNEYRIATATAGNMFAGDLCKSTGGGYIIVAGAADTVLGVFAGCQYTNSAGDVIFSPYWPDKQAIKSGTEAIGWVYDDPMQLFQVQADGAVALGDLGALTDSIVGAGNTSTGRGTWEVNSATFAGGGNTQIKVVDLVRAPGNVFGDYAKLVVMLNKHELKYPVATV